jgi:hypothetical protein
MDTVGEFVEREFTPLKTAVCGLNSASNNADFEDKMEFANSIRYYRNSNVPDLIPPESDIPSVSTPLP